MQIIFDDDDIYRGNKRKVRRPVCRYLATMIILSAFAANAAVASGYMTAPEYRQKMPSFKACLGELEARASEHRKQLKSRTFNADAGFQEVTIQALSNGVEIKGRNSARYKATLWYHNGRLNNERTQYEINHNWSQNSYECRGKTMIINDSQGYTLSTFEPIANMVP